MRYKGYIKFKWSLDVLEEEVSVSFMLIFLFNDRVKLMGYESYDSVASHS